MAILLLLVICAICILICQIHIRRKRNTMRLRVQNLNREILQIQENMAYDVGLSSTVIRSTGRSNELINNIQKLETVSSAKPSVSSDKEQHIYDYIDEDNIKGTHFSQRVKTAMNGWMDTINS